MSRPGGWRRVTRAERCPVCDRPDWCLLAGPEGDPTAAICARTESDRRAGAAGWLHRLRDDPQRTGQPMRRRCIPTRRPAAEPTADLAGEVAAGAVWCDENPDRLEEFADHIGLSIGSLRRLTVGYSPRRGAWMFPLRTAAGAVCGVRLRLHDGRKLSIRGGREGLSIPEGIDVRGLLCITEGPTDCAALLDLGLAAVGRPSCRGGVDHLRSLVGRLWPDQVAIVADGDKPGQDGAAALAAILAAYVGDVRVVAPPAPHKDPRDWKRAGATAADVLAAIDAAEPWRLAIKTRKRPPKGRKPCPTNTATM